jgi:hypothetical protein
MKTLALLLVLVSPASALAQPRADGLYRATYRDRASARSVEVPYGSMTTHVTLGRPFRARTLRLYSVANANDSYSLEIEGRAPCPELAVVAGGTIIAASGSGSDRTHCSVSFRLDRAAADRTAAALGTPRLDRAPIGERLQGRFVPTRTSYKRGAPIEIKLVIANPAGAPEVDRQVGGRQRGPRDNQFDFRVWRNGVELPRIEAFDFGGVTGFAAIPPGGTVESSERLERWADVSAPGHYRIECSWETELVEHGVSGFEAANRHRVWSRRFTGVIELDVR